MDTNLACVIVISCGFERIECIAQGCGLLGTDAADALGLAITQAHVGQAMGRLAQATALQRGNTGMYRDGRSR